MCRGEGDTLKTNESVESSQSCSSVYQDGVEDWEEMREMLETAGQESGLRNQTFATKLNMFEVTSAANKIIYGEFPSMSALLS